MRLALDSAIKSLRYANDERGIFLLKELQKVELYATHHYVRLLPKDRQELYLLQKDTNVHYLEFPLDYEITSTGSYYHDPSIPLDQITWQYVVVKPDYVFPSQIRKELLAEAFLPKKSKYYNPHLKGLQNPMTALEMMSFFITGNIPDSYFTNSDNLSSSNVRIYHPGLRFRRDWFLWWSWEVPVWRPQGNIRVENTELGNDTNTITVAKKVVPYTCFEYPADDGSSRKIKVTCYRTEYVDEQRITPRNEGVEGVSVMAWRFLHEEWGRTNTSGYFQTGEFDNYSPVNYHLYWDKQDFEVRPSEILSIAEATQTNSTTDWNLLCGRNSKDWYHATIFQAAYHYYYQDIQGLRRPPQGSFLGGKVTIKAWFWEGTSNALAKCVPLPFTIVDWINIYNPQEDSKTVYGTTIHEIAHVVHWAALAFRCVEYVNLFIEDRRLMESWATGVAQTLTPMKFPNFIKVYPSRNYTSIVTDLIDNNATTFDERGIDNVTGFTISQLESALFELLAPRWDNWKSRIKSKYPNTSRASAIDSLFNYWITR